MASKIKLNNNQGDTITLEHSDTISSLGSRVIPLDNITHKVSTIAELRAMTERPEFVYVTGYHEADDGAFGSHFFKRSLVVVADNGGTVIQSVNDTYELQYDGAVNVKWFGAVGDGIANDTDAIQKSINLIWANSGGELNLNDKTNTYRTTAALYFRVRGSQGYDKGINIIGQGSTISAEHTGNIIEILGGYNCIIENVFLEGNDIANIGLFIGGANSKTIVDNEGVSGYGNRSQYFDVCNVKSSGCSYGAQIGWGATQLDTTTIRNTDCKGSIAGILCEEGNTYATFIASSATGTYNGTSVGWLLNNGNVQMLGCFSSGALWAVDINGVNPITIDKMEAEGITNAIRINETSYDSWETRSNVTITSSIFFLTDVSNVGLYLGGYVSAVISSCYFGGSLQFNENLNYASNAIYNEVNTYFTNRDNLYLSNIDYNLVGAKDDREIAEHSSSLMLQPIAQNLIDNSYTGAGVANSATLTSNSIDFKGVPNYAHKLELNAINSAFLGFRGGMEYLVGTYTNAYMEGNSFTFGVWLKVDDAYGSDTITDVEIMANDTTSWSSTALAVKRPLITRNWQYFHITLDASGIASRLNFNIRNSSNGARSINFYAPMLTFKGFGNTYTKTTGTHTLG